MAPQERGVLMPAIGRRPIIIKVFGSDFSRNIMIYLNMLTSERLIRRIIFGKDEGFAVVNFGWNGPDIFPIYTRFCYSREILTKYEVQDSNSKTTQNDYLDLFHCWKLGQILEDGYFQDSIACAILERLDRPTNDPRQFLECLKPTLATDIRGNIANGCPIRPIMLRAVARLFEPEEIDSINSNSPDETIRTLCKTLARFLDPMFIDHMPVQKCSQHERSMDGAE